MFSVGGPLKSVQILTTCESFWCKSRYQNQLDLICRVLFVYWHQHKVVHPFLPHGRPKVILDSS